MFRTIAPQVLAFDAEWVPDASVGRMVYDLPDELDERSTWEEMWRHGGADEETARPYLKTILCRIVSIAGVLRSAEGDRVDLRLITLPTLTDGETPADEAGIIQPFLTAVGKRCPQLVGYNSQAADLRILVQRGVALGLRAPDFCRRPERPWDGTDYFTRSGEWHLDLAEILGGWGRGTPSLHEIAVASGIPGKLDSSGADVADLWLAGEYGRIIAYNELDAFTTYLLWLRTAHFVGHLSGEQYREELSRFRDLLGRESQDREAPHIAAFLAEWDRLRERLRR
jgi:3'-5' exonuclease